MSYSDVDVESWVIHSKEFQEPISMDQTAAVPEELFHFGGRKCIQDELICCYCTHDCWICSSGINIQCSNGLHTSSADWGCLNGPWLLVLLDAVEWNSSSMKPCIWIIPKPVADFMVVFIGGIKKQWMYVWKFEDNADLTCAYTFGRIWVILYQRHIGVYYMQGRWYIMKGSFDIEWMGNGIIICAHWRGYPFTRVLQSTQLKKVKHCDIHSCGILGWEYCNSNDELK